MSHTPLKTALVSAFSIIFAGYIGTVRAHEQQELLENGSKKTDLYQVTCVSDAGGDTSFLEFQIGNNSASTPPLSIQAYRGSIAKNSTDLVGGDGLFSPITKISGGNGVYYLLVDKVGLGVVDYIIDFHCKSASGEHTGTSMLQLQGQSF